MKQLLLPVMMTVLAMASETFYEPSFSCDKVIPGSVEYRICTDATLSALDIEMNRLYKKSVSILPEEQFNKLKRIQLNWLKKEIPAKVFNVLMISM